MPLFWLSISFITGGLIASVLSWQPVIWLSLGGLVIAVWLLSIVLHNVIRIPPALIARFATSASRLSRLYQFANLTIPVPLLLVFLALGAIRYQLAQPDLSNPLLILHYNDRDGIYEVEGILLEPPDLRETYTNLRIEVERVRQVGGGTFQPARGRLLAKVPFSTDWRYGDRLLLSGELDTPPEAEDFSYREYLNRQRIFSLMLWPQIEGLAHGQGNPWWARLYAIRERLLSVVYRLYPDPEASLLAGILLGDETGIPRDVAQAFRDTGTAHIIAISGFNITIIAGYFSRLFGRLLGRWRGALVAGVAIAMYTLLVGAGASVVRAAIMGGLALFRPPGGSPPGWFE